MAVQATRGGVDGKATACSSFHLHSTMSLGVLPSSTYSLPPLSTLVRAVELHLSTHFESHSDSPVDVTPVLRQLAE